MLKKEELQQYFGPYCLMGDLQELYFGYDMQYMTDSFFSHMIRKQDVDHVSETKPFEEYDAEIEYFKELGRLIDKHYDDYCKHDQEYVDKFYEFVDRNIKSRVFKDIKSLMLEDPKAVEHFKRYYLEDYDYMWNNALGYSSWCFEPCFCKHHSYQYRCIEYSKQYDDDGHRIKKESKEKPTKAFALWNAAKELVYSLEEFDSLPLTELKVTKVLQVYSNKPEIREKLKNCQVLLDSMKSYFDELRANLEVSIDNVEMGREIFNSHLGEQAKLHIETPLEFIERVSNQELIDPLLGNSNRVPEYLAKIHNLIYAERI